MKFLRVFSDLRFYMFLSGLLLSITAAYYSIAGLIAIFSGVFLPIVLMGGSLEFAKIVTATYLYKAKKEVSFFMRLYMTIAVVILMVITSMGIFGFLSRAHLENTATQSADVLAEYEYIKSEVDADTKIISDIDKQLNLFDNTVKEDYTILRKQNKQRRQLNTEKKEAMARLRENNKKLAQANLEVKKVEVEVGPLKYIAELIYGNSAQSHFDSAVRLVIILLVIVFDPLAVMLLIAASARKTSIEEKDGRLIVHKNDVLTLEERT